MTKFKRKLPCTILWIPVVCVSGLLISGCGKSLLFTQEELKGLSSLKDDFTIIYYNEVYAYTNSKQLLVTTHRILQVGDNVKTAPDYFAVYDGSIFKLLSFEGKVLHTNGSVETYSQSDLSSFALSNSDRISDSYARALPIETSLSPGDLIEEVEIHEQKLPELGLIFSPSQLNTRAKNITWSIELSRNDKFQYRLLHDTLIPVVTYKEGNQRYTFHWNSYVPQTGLGEFDRINPFPELLAALVYDSLSPSSWKEFGDWYLALVDKQLIADDTIKTVVQLITGGRQTNVEKLNAIFNYCQKNVRYEQVYFAMGEFIPNIAPLIFSRKYGDCKDYATLIHTMAHCAGIPTNLVLCHRGRGREFCEDIPVAQFNHMIVHYTEDGVDYWYDGTNRIGEPGITTTDLINADALVMEPGNSRIITIKESSQNRMDICGRMSIIKNSLTGNLSISFTSQYAIDLYYREIFLNQTKMQETITKWLHKNLNTQMRISDLTWMADSGRFTLKMQCELPNAVTRVGSSVYIGFDKFFPKLVSDLNPAEDTSKLFYYPNFNRVMIDIVIPQLHISDERGDFHFTGLINISPGPFLSSREKNKFLDDYRIVSRIFHQKMKFIIKDIP